ncbi:MAG: hypothetical protein CMM93_01575 [Rickettsiales bacterium]|nr:hypothetical protein [Rickettsiales bacterium]|tara:strand:+ start:86 stop:361 length:276 start_codon:yes stop_codon:yes gene_type:complete
MKVKVLKPFYGTGYGQVLRGQMIDISDHEARQMAARGLIASLEDKPKKSKNPDVEKKDSTPVDGTDVTAPSSQADRPQTESKQPKPGKKQK